MIPHTLWHLLPRFALSLPCLLLVVWGVFAYPLPSWPLSIALLAYAVALWRWPGVFLVIVPLTLPALDLGTWTGWSMVAESDLVVLTTIAILVLRDPPDRIDLWPTGLAGTVLVLLAAAFAIGTSIGLATPTTGGGISSNPYLRPDNAMRLAKPVAEMLALLPFMRRRYRMRGDLATLFGWGMLAGAGAVAIETLAERAVFPGVFNFASDYRVAAAFSSMHVGGGHIGTYVAMTVPFLLGVSLAVRDWRALPILFAATFGAGYTLVVTFARTAYAAGAVSAAVAIGCVLSIGRRANTRPARLGLAMLFIAPVLAGVVASASSGFMRERLSEVASGLRVRQSNWRHFEAVHDASPLGTIFGLGLGTYPRIMLARGTADRPSDFRLETDNEGRYLTITALTPLFIGQKISLPSSGELKLALHWRAGTSNAVIGVTICEKLLLYSDNCRGQRIQSSNPGKWGTTSVDIPLTGLGMTNILGVLGRPIEFSIYSAAPNTTIAVRDLSLTDQWGREVLTNGDFRHGLDRWIFTDDSHIAWRLFDVYLMLLFETGLLGLLSFAALCCVAIGGGVRALRRGEAMGAAVIGSVTSFLISGLFDNVMEAPRLATVFLLVCSVGLILWEGHWQARGGRAVLSR